MLVADAYQACEAITASEARNFAYGIRLLPPAKRQAMSALYAVARRIDDIGDGEASREDKRVALARVGSQVDAVVADGAAAGDDPVLVALADTIGRFGVPVDALHELIDGCRHDVDGVTYERFDDLVSYCRLVAGTVGRLSLAVYGCPDPARAGPLADALGVALQITNILRDIVEDRDTMGRVYLPAEDIRRFGAHPDLRGPADAVIALVAFEAGRAERWYEDGLALLPMLDHRSRACTAAMAGIYHDLLDRIRRDPAAVLRTRVSVPAWRKASVAVRALAVGTL